MHLYICPNAGLINDIMSKGKRMTYEELCNAVLPVWFFISVAFVVSTYDFPSHKLK